MDAQMKNKTLVKGNLTGRVKSSGAGLFFNPL